MVWRFITAQSPLAKKTIAHSAHNIRSPLSCRYGSFRGGFAHRIRDRGYFGLDNKFRAMAISRAPGIVSVLLYLFSMT